VATLDALRTEIRRKAERIARASAVQLEADLKRTAPIGDTKRLQKSTTVRVTGVGDVIVTEAVVDVPYAEPVIKGARPHVIKPRKGQFLAFAWGAAPANIRKLPDGRVLVRQVNHPGNEPNTFFVEGINRWRLILQQMANRLR
jgi:hypothetical protein